MEGAPIGSAIHRAQQPDSWWWTHNEELLALIFEQLDIANRMMFVSNTASTVPSPEPITIPRPWKKELPPTNQEPPEEKPLATPEQMKSFFGSVRTESKE